MRVAMMQVASPTAESTVERVARVGRAIDREKALRGIDLLVLPELWNVGYFAFDEYAARAEDLTDGVTLTAGRNWAARLAAHVHLGSIVEIDRDGDLHNTSVVIGPDGSIENTYRKVHTFGYGSREATLIKPGDVVSTSDVAGLTTGITTCYDLRFPELYRSLVDQGAEQVVVCAAWPEARLAHWRLFTSVRAVEQQVHLVACNAVGDQGGVVLGGHSRIVDPTGDVVVEAGQDEGFTYADLDITLPQRVRAEFPALADRRWPTTPTPIKELA